MNKLSEVFTDVDLVEVKKDLVSKWDINNAPSKTTYQEYVNGEWVEVRQYETVKSES